MHTKSRLFTIGYSPHTVTAFIEVLRLHGITAVADVRSSPYSSYKPEFNKNNLGPSLKSAGIEYVWLGDSLGPRYEDNSVFIEGRADYEKIAEHSSFQEGLLRVRRGMETFVIVLMCAEKDPVACHRAILVSRYLKQFADIHHILWNGDTEPHSETEKRLINLFEVDQLGLPGMEVKVSLENAYRQRAKEIAWRPEA